MLNTEKYKRHPALQIIIAAIRREQKQQCWFLGFLAITGLGLFVLFAHQVPIMAAIGFGLLLIGSRFLFIKIRDFENQETYFKEIIFKESEKVVWVYTIILQRMPFGFQIAKKGLLYLKLSDGDEISVSLPEKQLRLASHFLDRLLPDATFGYTEERAQWYNAHPEMLRKEEEK